MVFIKKLFFWGVLAGVAYALGSYHFIFINKTFHTLKKSSPTLNYTFFSTEGKTNAAILKIDALRDDGIADLLVETGRMTREEGEELMARYEENGY